MKLLRKEDGIMKLDLGWTEVGLAALVIVLSIGGSLISNAYQAGQLEQRVTTLESRDGEVLGLLRDFTSELGDLNVVLGRMDERLKNIENAP